MGIPTAANIKWRPGEDGVGLTDGTPYCGAVDMASELSQGAAEQIIAKGFTNPAGGAVFEHHGGFYASNEEGAGGSLESAYLWLPNGGLPLPAAGQFTVTAPSDLNDGLELRLVGLSGGVNAQEVITVAEGAVVGSVSFDLNTRWFWETVGGAALSGAEGVDDLVLSVAGNTVAIVRAPDADNPNGQTTGGSIFEIAIADTADVDLDGSDRLLAPVPSAGSLTSFSSGAILPAAAVDESHSIGTFADGTTRAIAIKKHYVPGLQPSKNGIAHKVGLDGSPVA